MSVLTSFPPEGSSVPFLYCLLPKFQPSFAWDPCTLLKQEQPVLETARCFPIQRGFYSCLEKNWLVVERSVVVTSCTTALLHDFVVILC